MSANNDKSYEHLLEEINTPSLTTEDDDVNATIKWVLTLVTLLLTFIETTFEALHRGLDARIAALESRPSAAVATTRSQTKAAAKVPTASTSTVPLPTTPDASDDEEPVPVTATPQRNTSDPRTRIIRCDTCHASNHIAKYCRTLNPAAMRKRVATNQRKKKNARATATVAATSLHHFPQYLPPPFPYVNNPPIPAWADPKTIAAFSADAHELRRRRQQSTQDKRRVRRSAAPPTA